jgi:uncharacterized membrane protein YhaH (DUF805 family)/phage shock protein A
MENKLQANYLQVIEKYAVFSGRSGRQEYWWFVLANYLVAVVLSIAVTSLYSVTAINLSIISFLYFLVLMCPSLAVSIRRLHDIDRSGWWVLLGFIPILGSLALIVLHCLPGTAGENQYGPLPKAIGKSDDPERMMDLAEKELEDGVKKLKESVVANVTCEKQLEMQLKLKTEECESWSKRAALAVQSNNEDVARQCLVKKSEANQVVQALMEQLQTQKKATALLKARYAEMEEQLREFRLKKSSLAARNKASQAEVPGSTSASSAMDRWEEKIRMKEALTGANRELSKFDQEQEIPQLTKGADLEDELAALKRKLAGA